MTQLRDALQVVADAEAALRRLLEAAVAEQRYVDVAEIAHMAAVVAKLRGETTSAPTSSDAAPAASATVASDSRMTGISVAYASAPTDDSQSRDARVAKGREVYPRFEREADRLIKIGWSKKDRRAYEHRAPKSVIGIVGKALSSKRPGKVFTMDQFLPFKDSSGAEIPSYQAYLVLAWLRDLRIVQRRGKEGYVLRNGALDDTGLEQLWVSTTARD